MKNIKKLFALVLVALFGLTTNVEATSKWDVKREGFSKTTTEIGPGVVDVEQHKIIYTIPENYDGKNIYINTSNEILDIINGVYVPGQETEPLTIEIVNNSKYTYKYINDSLKFSTKNMSGLGEQDDYYSYTIAEKGKGIYVKEAIGFDGQLLAAKWSIKRTQNEALTKLFVNSKNVVGRKYIFNGEELCSFNKNASRPTVNQKMLTDEVLGAELVAKGYENGIADLDKYYLDFYNDYYKKTAKTIYDLPANAIYDYSNFDFQGGILNGNAYSINETNSTVSALGYDWFYNKGLAIYPIEDADGNKYKKDNEVRDKGFYLGNYMRGENTATEKVFRKDFNKITSDSSVDLTDLMIAVDGLYIVNAHQFMAFGFDMKFELARETLYGKLIVNYVDDQGNKLADSIITEAEVDAPYETIKKSFDGYEFLTVEGETKGNYINGTIEVTYIYTNAKGDIIGPDEDLIEPPHTDAEVTTSNIIMYFEEDKKRK